MYRSCGRLFCSECSEQSVPIPAEQLYTPVRVCNGCYKELTSHGQGKFTVGTAAGGGGGGPENGSFKQLTTAASSASCCDPVINKSSSGEISPLDNP